MQLYDASSDRVESGIMRNMGIPRREDRNDRQIDWVTLLVMVALLFVIFVGLSVIAKYIFG
jgi:type VI protein secretion system component VasF